MGTETIVYVDMDGVLCNYYDGYQKSIKENPAIKKTKSKYGFFRNLKPIIGTVESIKN